MNIICEELIASMLTPALEVFQGLENDMVAFLSIGPQINNKNSVF